MKKEIWIDGKLVDTMRVDFDTPNSPQNNKKFRKWTLDYIRKHK